MATIRICFLTNIVIYLITIATIQRIFYIMTSISVMFCYTCCAQETLGRDLDDNIHYINEIPSSRPSKCYGINYGTGTISTFVIILPR